MAYTYNPDFSRNPKGNFNLDNNFVSIKNGGEAYLLEDELNEMQWIQNEQRAQSMRNVFNSGFLYNTLTVSDQNANVDGTIYLKGYGNTELDNAILFNIKNSIDININGYIFKLAGTYKKDIKGIATDNNNIKISLPAGPASGSRYDLVCLEVWFEEINNTTNKDIKAFGGVPNNTIGTLDVDPRTNVETTHRIQLKWDISIIPSARFMTEVSPRNNTLNSRYVESTKTKGKSYSTDPNLYVSYNNSNVIDGVYYAIPIVSIQRTAGNSISLNDITNLMKVVPLRINSFDKVVFDGVELKEDNGKLVLKNLSDNNYFQVWNDSNASWNRLLNKPIGNEGQVYFLSEDNSSKIETGYTLYKANIVETTEELQTAKSTKVNFSNVFNTWYRFSHSTSGTYPALANELLNWEYNESNNSVMCNINSSTYIGFISNEKYDTYIHEATLASNNGDDDFIGVVVAFFRDNTGKENTISAIRSRNGFPYWFLVYNFGQADSYTIASMNRLSGDDINGDPTNTAPTAWSKSTISVGSRIRVERTGDIINVYASPFGSEILDTNSKLSINLASSPKYSIFRGACAYGYSCYSQYGSTFSNIYFAGGLQDIYDALNNQVWVKTNNVWAVDPNKKIFKEIGIGKFVFNQVTGKTYYINGQNDIVSISSEPIGRRHIPAGGKQGDILEWNSDGKAEWISKHSDDVTFEAARVRKRGVANVTLDPGVSTGYIDVDLSKINFYNAATYSAYYINDNGTKEQIPTTLYSGLTLTDIIKANVNNSRLEISVTRANASISKTYKVYYVIYDIDNSLTAKRAGSISVLNVYPGTATNYTFTNFNGQTFTLPQTAQCKRWMEEPNDENPKGYGQGVVLVDAVNIDDFNLNPYNYLKDSGGNWKYQTVYLGAWDCNNSKALSTIAQAAIRDAITSGIGYITGHDTNSSNTSLTDLIATDYGVSVTASSGTGLPYYTNQITTIKEGLVSSFPWNLGSAGTVLNIPYNHTSQQFYEGDVWFKYVSPDATVTNFNGKAGTSNFYLGTYKNTAFIQTGHSNGTATPDEQKILANVFYYLATYGK